MKKYRDDVRADGVLSITEDTLGRRIYWNGFKRVCRRKWLGPGWFKITDVKGKVIPPNKLWDVLDAAKVEAKKKFPGRALIPRLHTRPVS